MEIQGYPNYLIYEDGRVWSKIGKGRFLKSDIRRGYLNVVLCNGSNQHYKYLIHRLVAEYYIPNPENKPEVDHINRIKNDNRIENLRWVTKSENQINRKYKVGKSGHKHICVDKIKGYEVFVKRDNKRLGRRYFRNITDALCYKFIILLKIKSNIK
jgi:hypothetical protein